MCIESLNLFREHCFRPPGAPPETGFAFSRYGLLIRISQRNFEWLGALLLRRGHHTAVEAFEVPAEIGFGGGVVVIRPGFTNSEASSLGEVICAVKQLLSCIKRGSGDSFNSVISLSLSFFCSEGFRCLCISIRIRKLVFI